LRRGNPFFILLSVLFVLPFLIGDLISLLSYIVDAIERYERHAHTRLHHHHHLQHTTLFSAISLIADSDFFAPILDGFFDAGMLRQALNANRAQNEPVERDVIRRNIGRRLRLAEY